jgi:uncharacterized membrane protein YidH (DUF202 family)
MTLGLVVAAVGGVGLVAPSALLDFGQSLQTTQALYIVAVVRVVFGAILVSVAPASRMPGTLRILGAFIIVAGVATPISGAQRAHDLLDWWSSQDPLFTRAWAAVAVVFGMFIVYAVAARRRSAS